MRDEFDLETVASSDVFILRTLDQACEGQLGALGPGLIVRDDGTTLGSIATGHFSGRGAAQLAGSLLAVQVVVAVKVMDSCIRKALFRNNCEPKRTSSAVAKQARQLDKECSLPVTYPTWRTFVKLFGALLPYRNEIVHGGWGLCEDGVCFTREGFPARHRLLSPSHVASSRTTACTMFDLSLDTQSCPQVLETMVARSLNDLCFLHCEQSLGANGPQRISPIRREVNPSATTLAPFTVNVEHIRQRLAQQSATASELEITYGNPATPLSRYVIPYDSIEARETIELGEEDGEFEQWRVLGLY